MEKQNKREGEQGQQARVVPEKVIRSTFGCGLCLWRGVECVNGSKYQPKEDRSCGYYNYCN